jgi:hypothetical protein
MLAWGAGIFPSFSLLGASVAGQGPKRDRADMIDGGGVPPDIASALRRIFQIMAVVAENAVRRNRGDS